LGKGDPHSVCNRQIQAHRTAGAMDAARTRAHDLFIEACDMMGRCMQNEKEDFSWRGELGNDRKEIGDFACYIHLILGLVAR